MLISKILMEKLLYIMVNKYLVSFYVGLTYCVQCTASRWGHKDIVEILLSKGGDVNVTYYDGSTPLHFGE
jgi:hypothetical protein